MKTRLAATVTLAAWGWAASALGQATPEQMRERGVLFYAPFEGTTRAVVAAGRAEPWVERDVLYTTGVVGQAAQLLAKPSRYVAMPGGQQRKYMTGQSMLVYEGLGNIYRRRGTLAFWVLTPFDASDDNLLTGANLSGPCVIGISAKGVYPAFFHMVRRKGFFDLTFGGRDLAGKSDRFGSLGQKIIPRWKADSWRHVAVMWDDRKGWAVFLDGDLVDKSEVAALWQMLEPDTIALGSVPLRARDLWPVNQEYAFDEVIVFCRPLMPEEVARVRDGRYAELRPVTAEDWPFDAAAQRSELGLDEAANRPTVDARLGPAMIRQAAVDQVEMRFHRRYALVDGSLHSTVRFEDGGLPFDVPATFRFARPCLVNHAVAAVDTPNGSYLFGADPSDRLAELMPGRSHVPLPFKTRDALGVLFKGRSEAREVAFYAVSQGGQQGSGRRHWVSGEIEANRFADAAEALLAAPEPVNRPVLYVTAERPAQVRSIARGAFCHTFIVLEAAEADRFVDTLRLNANIRPSSAAFAALVRVHDPLIPGRIALDLDIGVKWTKPGEPGRLALDMGPPGLIVPAGGRLVLDLVLDVDWRMDLGGEGGAWIEVIEGDPKRISREFAQAQLRNMWDGFLRRLNQNRFLQAGEDPERNPIWRGLTLAEKYDPDNEQVKAWFGWSRLRPWPKYDYAYLDGQPGPKWAVYLREAVRSMQAIVHWWLDNRSNEFGYLVGGGNQWNDITDFYSTFVTLGVTASDRRLVDAIERYQDAHWNSGRMKDGYALMFTDMLHALEEGTELQPNLHVLRPGTPRHVYRDLLTSSNYSKWLGRNDFGHIHFRSNYFNAARMLTDGVYGRDPARLGESVTTPGRWLWWYNGHPAIARLLTDYADSWLADTLRATKTKPAGMIPKEVQFATDELFSDDDSSPLVLDMFLSMYQRTGDRKYLEPVRLILEKKEALGGAKWALSNSRQFVDYRLLTGDTTFDKQLHEMSEDVYQGTLRGDGFFQRGFEQNEAQALYRWVTGYHDDDLIEMLKYVIRNNRRGFYAYTWTDPPTDRVNPWGREIVTVAMLGGRAFSFRWSMPIPTAAFAWEGTDADVVSLVFENRPDAVRMLVHNFKDRPVRAGVRALRLAEGCYRLAVAPDRDSDRKPDAAPRVEEVELRRFTPALLTLSPAETTWVELTMLKERPRLLRPDLAVTLASEPGQDGKVIARIHNLGGAEAPESVARLLDAAGKTVAEARAPALKPLDGFEPRWADVALDAPRGLDPKTLRLSVDPDDRVDEVNESNNEYPLSAGVPPPVESQGPPGPRP